MLYKTHSQKQEWFQTEGRPETYVEKGKTMNYKFFIYMPQCDNINIVGHLGGRWGGGGGILLHIYPLIYINLHVKYGSNMIRTP